MKIYLRKLLLLLALNITILACGQVENPCLDKIDYSNNEVLNGIDIDALFSKPSQQELEEVIAEWEAFDPSSNSSHAIDKYQFSIGRQVQILQHTAENQIHYGGVIFPSNFQQSKTYPLMVWAEGLNQNNPMVDMNGYGAGFSKMLPNHFVLIPSFRGQSLKTMNGVYCSDGFFGDAFDGATDDALRFMELVLKQHSNTVDFDDITFYGGSRGGTVALLAGIRDSRITKVVCQSGPVQFHNRWCYDSYGFQFKYQFLSEVRTINEIRKKLIRCSPLYFVDRYRNKLFVVHGKNDPVVPLWNAQLIVDKMDGDGNLDYLFTDDGHGVRAAEKVSDWMKGKLKE